MIDTAAIHHFGDTLVDFRRAHPDVTVRLFVQPSNQLLDLVRSGAIDAAIVVDEDCPDPMFESCHPGSGQWQCEGGGCL